MNPQPAAPAAKRTIAAVLDACGLTQAGLAAQRAWRSPYLRIVNYHDVPPSRAREFEEQLRWFVRQFAPATRADLAALVEGAPWRHDRPGLLLTFDDGLRSHAEVAAPLLEKHGFRGWFFVPIGLVELDPADQPRAARDNLVLHGHDVTRDPRVFLDRDELRGLADRHEVGCHTATHRRLAAYLTAEDLDEEIDAAHQRLENATQRTVDSFAWVGGEEWAYSSAAARRIRARFRYAFTTNTAAIRSGTSRLQLDRTHLEADFPDSLLRFQLCGLMDLRYAGKRRRLREVLDPPPAVSETAGISRAPAPPPRHAAAKPPSPRG